MIDKILMTFSSADDQRGGSTDIAFIRLVVVINTENSEYGARSGRRCNRSDGEAA